MIMIRQRSHLSALLAVLLLVTAGAAFAQAKAAPTVTISVTDEPVAEVAAELSKQLGFTVAVVEPCAAKVTLELTDAKPEEAIAAFAKAFDGTWLRSYFLQPKDASYVYTPAQYLTGLTTQRQTWFDGFTEEERRALFQSWYGGRGGFGGRGGPGGGPGGQGGPGAGQPAAEPGQPAAEPGQPAAAAVEPKYTREQMAAMPGAGRSSLGRGGFGGRGAPGEQGQPGQPGQAPAAGQPAAGGQPAAAGQPGAPGGQGGQPGQRQQWTDPVGDLIIPVRLETVTLKEDNADLQDAIYDFMTASGFITVASTDLAGAVTCDLKEAPIGDVLDKLAAAANAKWQPVYLLALPRALSETEVEARQEARFQGMWSQFWAKPPDERKKDIQNRVDMITRMAERSRQAAADGQPQRGAGRMQRMGSRMMSRLERYSATLSMEQRREILPLVKALGAAVNNR
ncbi:MAG: hypothetical protein ACYC63_18570 [Armatimonadota bacterium]